MVFEVGHGLPRWLNGKESTYNAGNEGDSASIPGSGRSPGRGQPTPVFLPGKSHGQKNLVGYIVYRVAKRQSTHAQ